MKFICTLILSVTALSANAYDRASADVYNVFIQRAQFAVQVNNTKQFCYNMTLAEQAVFNAQSKGLMKAHAEYKTEMARLGYTCKG